MPDLLVTITSFNAGNPAWPALHGSTAPVVGGVLTVEGTLSCSTSPNPTGEVWLRINGVNSVVKNIAAANWSKNFNIAAGDRTKRIGVFARAEAGNESAAHALTVTLFASAPVPTRKRQKKKGKMGTRKATQEIE